jgi:hypothetical protein
MGRNALTRSYMLPLTTHYRGPACGAVDPCIGKNFPDLLVARTAAKSVHVAVINRASRWRRC